MNKPSRPSRPARLTTSVPATELDAYLFGILLDNLPDTIYFKDKEGKFIRINKAQAKMLGISSPADAIGKSDFDYFEFEFAQKAAEDDKAVLVDGESVVNKQERVQRKDGVWVWVTATKVPILNADGEIIGLVGMSRDITKQKNTEQELRDVQATLEAMTRSDPLTGLLNRRGIIEILEYEKGRTLRTSEPFCVILGDLDDFKDINDTKGHDAGDFVLKQTTNIMNGCLRKQDSAARWGGEEFLIVLPATKMEGGVALGDRIRQSIDGAVIKFKEEEITLSISLGVSCHNTPESIEETIKRADVACYRSKAIGKNRVTFI